MCGALLLLPLDVRFYFILFFFICQFVCFTMRIGSRDCVNTAKCLVIHFTRFRGYRALVEQNCGSSRGDIYIRKFQLEFLLLLLLLLSQQCELIANFDFNSKWRTLVSIDKQQICTSHLIHLYVLNDFKTYDEKTALQQRQRATATTIGNKTKSWKTIIFAYNH